MRSVAVPRTLLDDIAERAERAAEAIALLHVDGASTATLAYGALWRRSERVAAAVWRAAGEVAAVPVVSLADEAPASVIALLGITLALQRRGAYLQVVLLISFADAIATQEPVRLLHQ